MRYSSGHRWAGKYDPEKPAFWRTWQNGLYSKLKPDEMLLSGYTKNQTWIALCKSWNGFLLAKREGNDAEMKQYIGQIRKLQKDLGLEQTEFDIGDKHGILILMRKSESELGRISHT